MLGDRASAHTALHRLRMTGKVPCTYGFWSYKHILTSRPVCEYRIHEQQGLALLQRLGFVSANPNFPDHPRPTPSPSCQPHVCSVSESVSVLPASSCCILDPTCKWCHVAFVFFSLTSLSMIISRAHLCCCAWQDSVLFHSLVVVPCIYALCLYPVLS